MHKLDFRCSALSWHLVGGYERKSQQLKLPFLFKCKPVRANTLFLLLLFVSNRPRNYVWPHADRLLIRGEFLEINDPIADRQHDFRIIFSNSHQLKCIFRELFLYISENECKDLLQYTVLHCLGERAEGSQILNEQIFFIKAFHIWKMLCRERHLLFAIEPLH